MKQLKSDEKQGSNAKKFWSVLRSNKGFSLAELMVTTAIGAIVAMGIASVFVFAMQQFTILVEKNAAEESILNVSYYLRNYLAQAVDTYAVSQVRTPFTPPVCPGGTIDPGCTAAGAGQFDYNFDILNGAQANIPATDAGYFARMAIFNREAAVYNTNINAITAPGSNLPSGGSALRATGIFVKDTDPAQMDPDLRSANIFFDYNSGGGALTPDNSDLRFSRLHRIRVQRVTCNGAANGFAVEAVEKSTIANNNGRLWTCVPAAGLPGGGFGPSGYKIKTVTIEVTARYFKSSNKTTWNYRAGIPGVPASDPYRDIVQVIKINFKDNTLTRNSLTGATGTEERVHGSMYFYDYLIPATRSD